MWEMERQSGRELEEREYISKKYIQAATVPSYIEDGIVAIL